MNRHTFKKYYHVLLRTYSTGEISASIIGARYAATRPEGSLEVTDFCRYDYFWLEDYQETLNFVGSAITA